MEWRTAALAVVVLFTGLPVVAMSSGVTTTSGPGPTLSGPWMPGSDTTTIWPGLPDG